jgi:hypothetical protein
MKNIAQQFFKYSTIKNYIYLPIKFNILILNK